MARTKYDHLSREELLSILVKRDAERKLGLVWERDLIEHDKALNSDFVALDLIQDVSCGAAPYRNLVIEGDNFDALRYLAIAYRGKVKCIYIDPPYNTGNKDFIYNDRFLDKDDAWKHSKWLEFMYRRLALARDLLANDGVLLVSINDENRAKLELLLDHALPGMRLGSMVWRTRQGSNADQGCFLSSDHEHILVYGRPEFSFIGFEKSYEMYGNSDQDPKGEWRPSDLTLGFSFQERPNLYYPLRDPETDIFYPANPDRVWVYATEARLKPGQRVQAKTMEEFIDLGQILFPQEQRVEVWNTREDLIAAIENGDVPKTGKNPMLRLDLPDLDFWIRKKVGFGRPAFKRYKADLRNLNQPLSSWIVPSAEQKKYEAENSFVSGTNQEGAKAVSTIFGTKTFNYAKPPSLIKELVRQATANNDLVMDFFGGSGTTAQAVLEVNQEDEDQRRFIIVSSTEATAAEPDKNICRDVCAERIRRVINGYSSKEGTGGNFAYLRTRLIPFTQLHLNIQHDQIWYALQLIHTHEISPFIVSQPYQFLDATSSITIYASSLGNHERQSLFEVVNATTKSTVIYTWQPGIIAQDIYNEYVSIEKIPEYLVERFGDDK